MDAFAHGLATAQPPEAEAAVWVKWNDGDPLAAAREYADEMLRTEGPNRREPDGAQTMRVMNELLLKAGLPAIRCEIWTPVHKGQVDRIVRVASAEANRNLSKWAVAQIVGEWIFEDKVGEIPERTVVRTYMGPVSPCLAWKAGDFRGLDDVVLVWWPLSGDRAAICGWDYVSELTQDEKPENSTSTWDLRPMFWWRMRDHDKDNWKRAICTAEEPAAAQSSTQRPPEAGGRASTEPSGGPDEGQQRKDDRPGHAGHVGRGGTAGETSGQPGGEVPAGAGGIGQGRGREEQIPAQAGPSNGQRLPAGPGGGDRASSHRRGVRMTTRNVIVVDLETAAFIPQVLYEKMLAKAQGKVKREVIKSANPKPATLDRVERDYQEKLANIGAEIIDRAALSPRTGRIVAAGIAVKPKDGKWTFSAQVAKEPEDEAGLLKHLDELLMQHNDPLLVTFNGRRFDVPFIGARAMVNNLALEWPMPYGYAKAQHVDLMDYFPDGGLEDWCLVMGGKNASKVLADGGAGVKALVDAGDWETLHDYAKDDAMKTAALWERVQKAVRW